MSGDIFHAQRWRPAEVAASCNVKLFVGYVFATTPTPPDPSGRPRRTIDGVPCILCARCCTYTPVAGDKCVGTAALRGCGGAMDWMKDEKK